MRIYFAVPLLSRVCPSDVCRIWKSGANLRVDATLLGFENMTWIRGRRSYIFRGDGLCFGPFVIYDSELTNVTKTIL